MSKKILSVVLALVLIMSVFSVAAFAVNYEELDDNGVSEYTQTWALGDPVKNEDGSYSVDVSLTTNYATGAIEFVITETDEAGVIALNKEKTTVNESVINYDYELSVNETTGKVMIIPQATETSEIIEAPTVNGVILTLNYTYTGTGFGKIAIANDPKNAANADGTLIALRSPDANLAVNDFVAGQTVLSVGEEKIIGEEAAAEAELVLTEAGSTAGVIIDTAKTFGGAYAGVVYGFTQAATATFRSTTYLTTNLTATNEGTFAFTTSSAGGYGTGATIEVLNKDGSSTGKIYVICIFGDADCNGLVNGNDTKAVREAVSNASLAPANSVIRMAANVQLLANATMMHTLNGNDTKAMKAHVDGSSKIVPATYASRHYGYNTFYQ